MADIEHVYSERKVLPAANFAVKHRDVFHLKNLYVMMHEWMVEEGYATRDDTTFPETFYLHRETQKSGNEIWIWWRMKKVPQNNQYYRYLMDIRFHVILLEETEIMHQGQKYKTNKGEVEVAVKASLEMDYMHEDGKGWRDNNLLKHFNDMFHKRLFKKNLEMHKHELYREAYRLQEAIKTYLKLKTYLPEQELQKFWPEAGVGEVV